MRTLRLARTSTSAAARPAAPAPITTTSTVSSRTGSDLPGFAADVLAVVAVSRAELVQSTVVSRAAAGLLVWLVRGRPTRAVDRLARAVAALAFRLGIRRRVTLDNLAHAFPDRPESERRAIARGAYTNMARTVVDSLRSLGDGPALLRQRIEVDDFGPVERALAAGRGLLVATAHFGSWELLGASMAQRVKLSAVVRPLRGGLNARLVEARQRSGLGLIPPRGALGETVAALRRNEVVTMLIDQAIGGKHALYVPFFGRPAATTPALSLAAARTGATTLVCVAIRQGDRLRFYIDGPFPVPHTGDKGRNLWLHTAQVTAALERLIRQHPEQWLWLHRRWKLAHPEPWEMLRLELLALDAQDQAVRAELAAHGTLFEGYHPRMEAVHRHNAERLSALIDVYGWPGRSLAGEDGAAAAWRIAHHAIGAPGLQRRFRDCLAGAAERGEVPPLQLAMLEDRIRHLEGRPSRYGTLLDWTPTGTLSAGPVEDPASVDARRAALGLPPLAEAVRRANEGQREPLDVPPTDWAAHQRAFEAWARKVGWR
jgi:Kdo2-lipid IVA lauroyltransferase/acyltransferase